MPSQTRQSFVVVGLGRFGLSLALELSRQGYDVLAIDNDRAIVQAVSDELADVLAVDATDEDALRSAGVNEFDVAVVAIATNFENSILVTDTLKQIGVATVICKALSDRHKRILLRVGADHVVLPEHEAGEQLAHRLTSGFLIEGFELEPGMRMVQIPCPGALVGHSLAEADMAGRYQVQLLLITGGRTVPAPANTVRLEPSDHLLLIGPEKGVARLLAEVGRNAAAW
jgi:trk system potassium uptake protein TrkA